MFKKLFKKEVRNEEIFAQVSGELVKLENVPDPVFGQKIMGEGIAIKPSNGQVVAPVDGEITLIADTKHAFGIRTELGEEILVHIGLETVSLKGEGFHVLVKTGDKVVRGQTIVEADLDFIKKSGCNTIIPMVVTNSAEGKFKFDWEDSKQVIAGDTKVFTTKLK
ncbi:PTS glucose transporter subunit IIA [Bacillus sp. ISL-7]|uniref:PTS sugar transporter subunit IIA n=1 Tax=Bacillus sp. ISL-7 TaxID=2819136 RepID=UPI001BE90A5F|nr:PTS glucose transporter subunit IIA [Bacillus sp. ISL-7]MBT2738699.1 PTS glucose transporter subunit IIA [Bacillus sp. ISL-7]